MMNELISSIMVKDLVTLTPNNNLREAYNTLRSKKIHHLPIVEGRKLVGILTTYDIFKQETSPANYDNILIKDIMTTKLATLSPNDKVGTAVMVFVENLFHAVPIVDDEGNAVGIVTTLDVMNYSLKKEYPKQSATWGKK